MFNKCSIYFKFCIKRNHSPRIVTLCIFIALCCVACAPRSIYLNKSFNPPVYFGRHVVQQGETLYSIAWRYGRDLKELAVENKIKPPYLIFPGQEINLERQNGGVKKVRKIGKSGSVSNRNVTIRKGSTKRDKDVTKNKKHNKLKNIEWQWPYIGPILAKYSNNVSGSSNKKEGRGAQKVLNKGLDISGKLGSPIFAAASGEVVYAGNGLLGYGNLVIINHNEMYLSAYAHNKNILVKEGQKINKGDKIAEMGFSEKKQALLHFEIRRNGQPVDPMKYLPHQ